LACRSIKKLFGVGLIQKIIDFISFKIISPFNWTRIRFLFKGRAYDLTSEDREYARKLMSQCTHIWVSRRQTHLTTYLINFADFALALFYWAKSNFHGPRPKFGYWAHAFINTSATKIVEAVAVGVREINFDDAFDVDSVAALLPSKIPWDLWLQVSALVVKKAEAQEGKKYDSIFNIMDDSKVSCIELVRLALRELGAYQEYFFDFERTISQYKNVTPDMLYHSKSFNVVWEVRR
jgi:hypothetical protein